MRAGNPEIFVIGAGPVAVALAGSLRRAGAPVLGLWARRPEAARAAAAAAGIPGYGAAPPDRLLEAEVVLVAVRDDAIAEVAAMLVDTGLVGPRHVLVHCSGANPAADAFGAVAAGVGGVGTMHPLRAIVDGRAAIGRLDGTIFGVEGDDVGRAVVTALVRHLGGVALSLTSDQMGAYHAAAAMVANYAVTLVDAAVEVLTAAGIDAAAATAALLPLARGSLDNVETRGLPTALSGPIRRGDRATVARHLEVLAGDPEISALYRVLARRTVGLARACGDAAGADLDAIAAVLTERE
ncbi:DUF2520 domain-containing protein [Haliangium sp.]|uniref:DUF2520 domain-containing protein n=1 Tax=Haliangium sp. TaxID=2663208 RepID=UPI003D0999CB